jgi:hypothetical protein
MLHIWNSLSEVFYRCQVFQFSAGIVNLINGHYSDISRRHPDFENTDEKPDEQRPDGGRQNQSNAECGMAIAEWD